MLDILQDMLHLQDNHLHIKEYIQFQEELLLHIHMDFHLAETYQTQ
jgi:hypothetical protein